MEINSMYKDELREILVNEGEKSFRATQAFNFFHKNKKFDIINSNLSEKSKEILMRYPVGDVGIEKIFHSKLDSTKKILFRLKDNDLIESVLMSYAHGLSQCISTQVGCRMGCVFCASTKEGLIRNLSAGEMLAEVYRLEEKVGKIKNFILMGSGEPLDNMDNVIRFVRILNDPDGHNTSMRNITISTCGLADQIMELAKNKLAINLAISLHQTSDDMRSKIMPINKRFSIRELMRVLKYYQSLNNRRITFEYTLIAGENDRDKNILELKEHLSGIKSHVNLIPLNPIDEYSGKRPSRSDILKFQKKLRDVGINATIRRELGSDISASCGQLRQKHEKGGNNEIRGKN